MISNALIAIGLICLIIGILALVGLISAPGSTLLVIAICCLVVGIVLRGRVSDRL